MSEARHDLSPSKSSLGWDSTRRKPRYAVSACRPPQSFSYPYNRPSRCRRNSRSGKNVGAGVERWIRSLAWRATTACIFAPDAEAKPQARRDATVCWLSVLWRVSRRLRPHHSPIPQRFPKPSPPGRRYLWRPRVRDAVAPGDRPGQRRQHHGPTGQGGFFSTARDAASSPAWRHRLRLARGERAAQFSPGGTAARFGLAPTGLLWFLCLPERAPTC